MVFLIILATIVLLIADAVTCFLTKIRFTETLPLMMMIIIGIFLINSLNVRFVFFIGGRPFTGQMIFITLLLVFFAVFRVFFSGHQTLADRWLFMFVSFFVAVTLISGLINGSNSVRAITAVVAPLQTLIFTIVPMLLAFIIIDLLPRDRLAFQRVVSSFILLCGVLLPYLMLSMAAGGGFIGRFFGWQIEAQASGFAGASTVLGGRITSGMLVVLAYGFSLCRLLQTKKVRFLLPLVLCAMAILFSLSRSALAVMIIFHIVFLGRIIRKHIGRVILLTIVGCVFAVIINRFLPEQYNFDRFFLRGDESSAIRMSGGKGAWMAFLSAPVLGHGPGLLYDVARTSFLFAAPGKYDVPGYIIIEGYASPLEPHNTYAFLAAEYGFLGLVIFIGYMIRLWRMTRIGALRKYVGNEDELYSITFNAIWISFFFGMYTHSIQLMNIKACFIFWLFAFSGVHWFHCCVLPQFDDEAFANNPAELIT